VSEDNGLTGAHHQELTRTMIAPRRPPSSRPFLAAPRPDFYHPARAIDAALVGIERAIRRMAHEILERNLGLDDLAIIGLQTGGVELAQALAEVLREIEELEDDPLPRIC
jgi:hypothetical protein